MGFRPRSGTQLKERWTGTYKPAQHGFRVNQTNRDGPVKSRPWKVIAAEVEKEQDPKFAEFVAELSQALDDQIDGPPKPKPNPQGQ